MNKSEIQETPRPSAKQTAGKGLLAVRRVERLSERASHSVTHAVFTGGNPHYSPPFIMEQESVRNI